MNVRHRPRLMGGCFTLFLAFAPGHGYAPAPDKPQNYAAAATLEVSGRQGVVAFRLPLALYQRSQSRNLADLRVFDAQGVPQPHALHHPALERVLERHTRTAAVFPVHGPLSASAESLGLDMAIETRPDGSLRTVKLRTAPSTPQAERQLRALVLDFGSSTASGAPGTLVEALTFTPPPGLSSYAAQVWLETSEDLKRWDMAGTTELAWLKNGENAALANDQLPLGTRPFRYARLTWRSGKPVLFGAIGATLVTPREEKPYRESLWIKPREGQSPGDLVYPSQLSLPIEQIDLRFDEGTFVLPVTVGAYAPGSRRKKGDEPLQIFSPNFRATFYQIRQGAGVRRSAPIPVPVTHQEAWVLRPQIPEFQGRPELGLTWQPASVVFVAGGRAPYTLCVGRRGATNRALTLEQVAPGYSSKELHGLEQAVFRGLQDQAGLAGQAGTDPARSAARRRQLVLWGSLVAGMLLLLGMTRHLVRQMRMPPPGA